MVGSRETLGIPHVAHQLPASLRRRGRRSWLAFTYPLTYQGRTAAARA